MRKPFLVMLIIIAAIIVVAGGGAGTYLYVKHKQAAAHSRSHRLTPAQQQALQVTLQQMTTNLKSQGLIQFTLTMQADSKSTKTELTLMQNQIEDSVNEIMRQFTPSQLRDDQGLNALKQTIEKHVNAMLASGRVTKVYLSQVLVQ